MELTTTYILSQVFIIISYIFLISSCQLKNRTLILVFVFAASVMNGASNFCLAAYSGVAMAMVSMLRNIIFMARDKQRAKKQQSMAIEQTKEVEYELIDYAILAVLYLIMIGSAVLTYNGFLSLMCVFATMLFTYGVWQHSTKVYKFVGIPVSLFWIIYDIYITSWFGMFLETCMMISAIIGLYREYRDMKKLQ